MAENKRNMAEQEQAKKAEKTRRKNKSQMYLGHFGKPSRTPDLKKLEKLSVYAGAVAAILVLFVAFYFCLVPINVHSVGLWVTVLLTVTAYIAAGNFVINVGSVGYDKELASKNETWGRVRRKRRNLYGISTELAVIIGLFGILGSSMCNAVDYSKILTVEEAVFAEDLAQSLNTDSIALMDTNSARMLGDREIGSLASVVSQYNVSDDYTQIDLNGQPKKVSALDYAGFFKWMGNKSEGVPGYVVVDPVSMSASYKSCENSMIYVPSAYFGQDAARYIYMHNIGKLFGNLHFEIDESGKPYYVVSVYEKTVFLFGGTKVSGVIVLDPTTGELNEYPIDNVPTWIDVAIDGDLLCEQYNWFGTLRNGFINSIIGKKGCNQVTRYVSESEDEDDTPISDYGYVAKDGDIWIYTGVTSVNGDSSNIGFLLANERTGEAHYYSVAGADEKSAMAAAEGEVQEKKYQSSFPALINVEDCPTYIMVLKDAGGLVKMYAAVNVEQYNIVTTATTQAECLDKYRSILGIEKADDVNVSEMETESITLHIKAIKSAVIEGNTYLYLISDEDELFRAKASEHEDMLLLEAGDTVNIKHYGSKIVSCEKAA